MRRAADGTEHTGGWYASEVGQRQRACGVQGNYEATLEELELERLRGHGPHDYLLITPPAPDVGEDFACKAADHVRALDDLGLIVRLDF